MKNSAYSLTAILGGIVILIVLVFVAFGIKSRVSVATSEKRMKKIFVAMDTYYGLNMTFEGATFEELNRLDLLKGFKSSNLSGGVTSLTINVNGTGYTITEPQLGKKLSDKLVEKFNDGSKVASSDDVNFSVTIGT